MRNVIYSLLQTIFKIYFLYTRIYLNFDSHRMIK